MSRIALRKVKYAQNQLTRVATQLRTPTSRPTCTRPHNHHQRVAASHPDPLRRISGSVGHAGIGGLYDGRDRLGVGYHRG
jgi:hypothetical protein